MPVLSEPTGLVRAAAAPMTHHDQSNVGRKGLFHSQFHVTVHHLKQWGQELKKVRSLEAGADAETMEGRCLVCFLTDPRTTDSRENALQLELREFFFFNWGSLYSDDSGLCQASIKLASTLALSKPWQASWKMNEQKALEGIAVNSHHADEN